MQEFSYRLFHNPVGCLPISLSARFGKITLHPFQALPLEIGFGRVGFHLIDGRRLSRLCPDHVFAPLWQGLLTCRMVAEAQHGRCGDGPR
jgi:hypothetical protein